MAILMSVSYQSNSVKVMNIEQPASFKMNSWFSKAIKMVHFWGLLCLIWSNRQSPPKCNIFFWDSVLVKSTLRWNAQFSMNLKLFTAISNQIPSNPSTVWCFQNIVSHSAAGTDLFAAVHWLVPGLEAIFKDIENYGISKRGLRD